MKGPRMRRRELLAGTAALAASARCLPAIAQGSRQVLKFVPQTALSSIDPVRTASTVSVNHGYMVWDTLYGIDSTLTPRPQMCAGSEVSSDELTWTFTLRDGLRWHDDEPVRAVDCTASITRWAVKDPLGQRLAEFTNEMRPLDDKRFQIRLKQRFRQMLYCLGARSCFIMPERLAKTPASDEIKEIVGSGPFRFLRGEWDMATHAAYAKFEKYVPRPEQPDYFSGGKVVHFDRVEWIVEPDRGTAVAALQSAEVDWVEAPLIDLLSTIREAPGCDVALFDRLGALAFISFNHLYPPFNNAKLLRALLPAIDQKEYVTAWVGEHKELGKYPVGFFPNGTPMANDAGLEAFTAPRDLTKARRLVQESGYHGEKVVLIVPSDQPSVVALSEMTRDLFSKLGLNLDYQTMDFGTFVARLSKQNPSEQGGWNAFCSAWGGLGPANPGTSSLLRANGKGAWYGWPTDPKIEELRQQWFDAPDVAAEKAICEQIQLEAFQSIPFMPVGQWFYPWGVRKDLTDFVKCGSVLFWGVRRV